jgi:hypothetical protein
LLYFDLTDIGKCKDYFLKYVQTLLPNFQHSAFWVVGGLWCGWAKLNVVFLCRLVRWQNTSLNFAKRGHFVCHFSVRFLLVVLVFKLATNINVNDFAIEFRLFRL